MHPYRPFYKLIQIKSSEALVFNLDIFSHSRYTGPLQLTTVDCIVLAASYLPAALRDLLHGVQNATSHRAVSSGVSGLTAYLVVSGSSRVGPVLTANKWHQSVDRYRRFCLLVKILDKKNLALIFGRFF